MHIRSSFVPAALLALAFLGACGPGTQAADPAATAAMKAAPALQPYQAQLLDVAFRAASAFPRQPHLKNRSKAQELVVDACLELGQPERALQLVPRIDDWRRGAAYADVALLCAQRGEGGEARHCIELSEQSIAKFQSDTSEDSGSQGWRRDRVRARIARAWLALGESKLAEDSSADLADSEVGAVTIAESKLVDSNGFDRCVEELDREAASNDFDRLRGILDAYTELFARFYDDSARRTLLEQRVRDASSRMPAMVRIGLWSKLAEAAAGHGNLEHARELVSQAQSVYDAATWPPEFGLPIRAGLAVVRHRAGDAAAALRDARAALASYETDRAAILDIYRAQVLRSLAEAFASLGDRAAALSVYARAVEEGVVNPNSRPRAEDLSATCCSMAIHGVEPDASLLARIRQICECLGDPW